jgi:DNA polymerase-1
VIAFDTETKSLRWWEGDAFLATWADADREHWCSLEQRPDLVDAGFLTFLRDHETLIAHNAKFDAHQLRVTVGYDVFEHGHTLHDTALMSRVLFGSSRWDHGLEALSRDLLPDGGKASTKADASAIYKGLSGRSSMAHDGAYYDVWVADPEALEAYAMADVRDTYDLFQLLWPQLEEDERLMRIYEMELEVQEVLYHAERRGVRVDPAAVERLRLHHSAAEAEARASLIVHLGVDVDTLEGEGSTEALRDALAAAGVPLTELTEKSGELAVNNRVLAQHKDHPAVAALFDWRRARKFQSTYLAPLQGVEVVHTDFMQHEARTSRMSSRRPNLQNLPKRRDSDAKDNLRVRSVYVPREGYEFIVADYDQVEPRLLAWFLGDPGYRRVVAEGRTYELAAAAAWGGDPAQYVKDGPKGFLYPVAKMIYLAIAYGAGGKAIREQINAMAPAEYHVDLDWVKDPDNPFDYPPQAMAIKRRIVASIPGFTELAGKNGRLEKAAKKNGFVRTLFGRKQFLQHGDDGRPKYYVLLNQLIQGSAAEVMKQGAINVHRLLEPHGGYPLLFVHDELVCEVPKGAGEALGSAVADEMAAVYDLDPPLTAEYSVTDRSYAHA